MKSKLAITSFVFGLISLIILLTYVLLIHFSVHYPFGFNSIGDILVFFIVTKLFPSISFLGLITGVISIFIIRRYKLNGILFAVMGIVFSFFPFLLSSLLLYFTLTGLPSFGL